MPQKDYIIIGNNVYKRTDKLPEDVMKAIYEDEEVETPVAQKILRSVIVTNEWLGRLILEVQHNLWGNCSYAEIYGFLRDTLGYDKPKRHFEKTVSGLHKELHLDYSCPKNTLSSAFSRNKYLRYNYNKWNAMGALKRSDTLVKSMIDVINTE